MATNSKSTCSKRRLPRLRFSLRTLLLTMLAATVGFGLFNAYVEGYRVQRAAAKAIHQAGGSVVTTTGEPAWLCQLFGEENFQNIVEVDLRDADDPDDYIDHLVRLKHVKVLIVGGLKFKEEHLDRLARLPSLTHLILDSTGVGLDAVGSLRADRPDVSVFLSQRRAIARLSERHPTQTTLRSPFMIFFGFAGSVSMSQSRPSTFSGIADDRLFDVVTEMETRWAGRGFKDIDDLMCLHTLRCLNMSQLPKNGLDRFLAQFPEMESLRVDLTDVTTDEQLALLQAVPKLKRLGLYSGKISPKSWDHFSNMKNLESLGLEKTDVNSSDLLHLKRRSNLTRLDVRGTLVDDDAIATLSRMSQLKELHYSVGHNRNADGVEWGLSKQGHLMVCRALPDCMINGVLGAEVVGDEALEDDH